MVCWKGLVGYQIKATARAEENGELFDSIVSWVKTILPERIVERDRGSDTNGCFDISADAEKAGKEVL